MPADDRASGSRAADSTKMGNGKAAAHDTAAAGRQAAARESAAGSTAARREGGTAAGAGLVVTGAGKVYASRHRGEPPVTALRDVSLTVAPGAAVGLVGASGSGKSTLARLITGLDRPSTGLITFGGLRVDRLRRGALREFRKHVQMVFQDPYAALNPLHTVGYTLARPVANYLGLGGSQLTERVRDLLATVGLTPAGQFEDKLPHQLSGGQRQRVVIAHALASEPQLIVADEPVSMLDVSLRAGVLRLLNQLRRDHRVGLLYITHDLLSARLVTDDLLVLNAGRVVERGPTRQVLRQPADPYTRRLLAALPNPFADSHPAAAHPFAAGSHPVPARPAALRPAGPSPAAAPLPQPSPASPDGGPA